MVRKFNRQISFVSQKQGLPLLLFICSTLFACSQSPLEKEFSQYQASDSLGEASRKVAREDYKVVASSSKERPSWISHPQKFGEKELSKKNKKEQLIFSFETGPKMNKEMACAMARAYTRQDMTDFLVKYFREGEEGREWDSFLTTEGHKILREFFKEAHLEKTYWEHREYSSQIGFQDKKDAYICALLVSVNQKSFKKAFKKLQARIIKEFSYKEPLDIKSVQKVLDPDSFILFYQMNY